MPKLSTRLQIYLNKLKNTPKQMWMYYGVSCVIVLMISIIVITAQFQSYKCICRYCLPKNIIENYNIDGLTFVTYLSKRTKKKILKLSIQSWLDAVPNSKVLIFRNIPNFDSSNKWNTTFSPREVSYIPPYRKDGHKLMYVDDLFIFGAKYSSSKYTVIIKPDVFLTKEWFSYVKEVILNKGHNKTVIVGASKLTNMNYSINLNKIDHYKDSKYSDFYVIDKENPGFNLELVPPFVCDRLGWSEWMLGYLNKEDIAVSIPTSVARLHRQVANWELKDDMAEINKHTATVNKGYKATLRDIKWQLRNGKIVEK